MEINIVKNTVPKGYKQTEIGVIPEDWTVEKISDLCSITTGSKNTQDKVEGGLHPFFVRSQIIEKINSYSFNGEAVLTAGDGDAGKIFHYINGPFDFHQRVYKMSNFKPKLNGFYFYKYFSSKFYNRIMSMTAKSTVDSVRREMIADMLIAVPTPKEQTTIATALSDVDALISALETLIAKKRAIKTATMQQLLTGKKRLPGFGEGKGVKQTELGEIPEDWNILEFSDIAILKNERINPSHTGGGEFCIELEHIEQGYGKLKGHTATTSNSSIKNVFKKHNVLFGKLRSYLRKYWLTDLDGVCSTEIWVFDVYKDKAIPQFLYQIVQTDWFCVAASEAYGTHMPRADWNIIKELPIATPNIEEQTAIADVLSDIDNEIQILQTQLAKTQQLKQGMMQELLTGKTRLM